ncbi:MAG: RelA/SpoT domain-containing protein [Candidatus Diapherotrites archaeon]|nr:RelA/SpoT domain-containing protein [Candidatus Diapherotrites archaeon]
MQWTKPIHVSKSKIDHAGSILSSDSASEDEKNNAIEILDNFRAIHSYPMHVFKIRLKRKAIQVNKNALTAQRLKRIPAIIKKLKRSYNELPPTMKLSQMQDIGGCRAVLETVPQVRKLYQDYYIKGDLKHKRVGVKDYIIHPKQDGYRSIHIIYKYFSDKKGKTDYNGLLVEIQLRSKLQHLWATAIETVDFFTRQAIKSNEGNAEWMNFFRLVSSAFAKIENCPTVPGTISDKKELYLEIKKKEEELKVISKMKTWAATITHFTETLKGTRKAQYFLLELDILAGKLTYRLYTKEQEKKAIEDYAEAEKRTRDRKEYDVVLVGVDTISDLQKAYPNYFVDTSEFLEKLQKVINESAQK